MINETQGSTDRESSYDNRGSTDREFRYQKLWRLMHSQRSVAERTPDAKVALKTTHRSQPPLGEMTISP